MGVYRQRPNLHSGDNSLGGGPSRASWHGDAYVVPVENPLQALAGEGSYFVCANATVATEIAGHAAPAIADGATKPLLAVYNGGQRFIYPDRLWLRTDTPNASATETYFTVYVDSSNSRDSGGTSITPQSTRSDSPSATGASVYFGAVVATPDNARLVGQRQVRSVIQVAEDEYLFSWGYAQDNVSARVTTGTADVHTLTTFPPVAIAPGHSFLLAMICPSGAITAWDGEFEFGYIER